MADLNPTNLVTSKGFLIGFAAGVIVGAVAYKYVVVEKKISPSDLTNGIMNLAKKVGNAGRGFGGGNGNGPGGPGPGPGEGSGGPSA